jgi:protease I
MGNGSLQGLRVAILVTGGFEQVELEKPRAALDDAGADTVVISPKDKTVLGMNHLDKGDEFIVDQQRTRRVRRFRRRSCTRWSGER